MCLTRTLRYREIHLLIFHLSMEILAQLGAGQEVILSTSTMPQRLLLVHGTMVAHAKFNVIGIKFKDMRITENNIVTYQPVPMTILEINAWFKKRASIHFDNEGMFAIIYLKDKAVEKGLFTPLMQSMIDYMYLYNLELWKPYLVLKERYENGELLCDDDLPEYDPECGLPPKKIGILAIQAVLSGNPIDGTNMDPNYYATI